MISGDYSKARLSSIEAIAALRRAVQQAVYADTSALDAAADVMEDSIAHVIDADPLRRAYTELASLLRATSLLARWANAVRAAEPDAARFLTASRQAVRDLRRRIAPRTLFPALAGPADAIEKVNVLEDVEDVLGALLRASLPLPLGKHELRRAPMPRLEGAPPSSTPTSDATNLGRAEPVPVAFLHFSSPGVKHSGSDVITLQPDVLYDLALEVKLSRWPRDTSRIEFLPLHVEPAGTLTVPAFSFDRPVDRDDVTAEARAVELRGTGRVRVHGAQDLLARPLEVTYVGQVVISSRESSPSSERVSDEASVEAVSLRSSRIEVRGQHRLSFCGLDPRLTPITGFPLLDAHLLALRTEARRFGIPDKDLAPFLALLAATGRLAQLAITDALYPGSWTEENFQRDLRDRLRTTSEIGFDLEEHPHVAGGISDLVLRGIHLELKVEQSSGLSIENVAERYGQQATQYVAASGRRCGALVVLDSSAKTTAPGLVQNDIALRAIAPPSGSGLPVILGIVILRGNLALPSALSKGGRRRRKAEPNT
ncbi:MAG TPA: hypothetical protein VGE27_06975 [Gemmatimonas sp.]|uniref:hypothetical protein n=1 Tax=Gemmatimonas sp. TaxID=1962908 RepID=UPI002ED92F2E